MQPHPSVELFTAALLTGALCAVVLRRLLPWRGAIAVAALKAAIPLVFFSWYYTGAWTILDDMAYFREGRVLRAAGFNPITVFLSKRGFGTLLFVSNGYQFVYGWFNMLMQDLIAPTYWAPVFGNLVLTCIAAVLVKTIATECGASQPYARGLGVYFALQPELVAWSSFLNVKDILVMTLTAALLLGLVRLSRRFTWGALALSVLAGFILFWIRFYVPLVAGLAMVIARLRPRALLRGGVLVGLAAVAGLLVVLRSTIGSLAHVVDLHAADLAYGWLRTLLSPLPWSMQPEYGFLQVPAILHFALVPAMALGAYLLVKGSPPARLLFIYAALILLAVSAHPELQGPRHRIQILFILAWAEFHGMAVLAAAFLRSRRMRVAAAAAVT
ncbi:MAG TPA: hypothetical protein VHB25_11975 [Gemmatimonadaceae bacterium]|nr:hypothetical protein [Gemmatimonadaceae bacterium]